MILKRVPRRHPRSWASSIPALLSLTLVTSAVLFIVPSEAPAFGLGTSISLGTAGSYSALAGMGIVNKGPTTLWGNIGVSPNTTLTGFPPGIVAGETHANDDAAIQAKVDVFAAYSDAENMPSDVTMAADIGGLTLTPAVYSTSGTTKITGPLTLDAQGDSNAVFIFQIKFSLFPGIGSSVVLSNGAQASHVFWQVGSSTILETGIRFVGTILGNNSITLKTGATIEGRLLARYGTVRLENNVVTYPAGIITPEPTPTESSTPTPSPTVTPEPSATETSEPTPTETITPTVTPTPTITPEPTATETIEPTPTATITPTVTSTPTPTVTPEPSATASIEPTPTVTTTPSDSPTPSPSATETQIVVPTVMPSSSADPTVSPIATPAPTATETQVIVPTAAPSSSAAPTPQPTRTAIHTASARATATKTDIIVPTVTPSSSVDRTATATMTGSTPRPTEAIVDSSTTDQLPGRPSNQGSDPTTPVLLSALFIAAGAATFMTLRRRKLRI